MKQDLKTREDIFKLVYGFYIKVRADTTIGHFFNSMITDWDAHIEKLTDFWETNLFFKAKYKGNPKRVHIDVDKNFNFSIDQHHFGIWLNLWFESIEENFQGELANRAKNNARNMASHLFMTIYAQRTVKNLS